MGKLPFGKLSFGKMYIWEVAAWEIAHLGETEVKSNPKSRDASSRIIKDIFVKITKNVGKTLKCHKL